MKVCSRCGVEIGTLDGDNSCNDCKLDAWASRQARRIANKQRDAAMRSLGLVKVKGALGGTYWE